MAIQTINIGNLVNDGLGDDLRTAFQKVNSNFSELAASLIVTAANVPGTSGVGIFKEQIGLELQFKRLRAKPNSKISVEGFTDFVEIGSTQEDAFVRIDTDSNAINASTSQFITIQGGTNVSVTSDGLQVITVDTKTDFNRVLTSYDFGPISSNYTNAIQVALAMANIDFGTISNPSGINIDLGTI